MAKSLFRAIHSLLPSENSLFRCAGNSTKNAYKISRLQGVREPDLGVIR